MIGHFIFLAVRVLLNGTPEDLFWISHVGTLIGGIGALFKNRSLISIALVSLLGHHLFWLYDTSGWLISGQFPIGTTAYLRDATFGDWLQSANHFFSVPFLLISAYRQGGVEKHSWIWSTAIFACLLFLSFFFLSPMANINSAHRLWPGLDQTYLAIVEHWSWWWYLLSLVGLNGLGNYLPSNLILRVIFRFFYSILLS